MPDRLEARLSVDVKRRQIVRPHLEEQAARTALADESDNQSQQGRANTLPATIPSDGDGQQLGLVGCDPAESEADSLPLILRQDPRHAGCGQQLGDLLPTPTTFTEGCEGIDVERRSDVEVAGLKGAVREAAGQSTVRLWPSGRVILTPRR